MPAPEIYASTFDGDEILLAVDEWEGMIRISTNVEGCGTVVSTDNAIKLVMELLHCMGGRLAGMDRQDLN